MLQISDFEKYRKLYKRKNTQPPYMYKWLIKQALIESKTGYLSFNEILDWISENFCYYRKTNSDWKVITSKKP